MTGNQIPAVDEWVAVLNLACVVVSVVMNWWAARSGLFRFRSVHAAIAAVSMMYVVLYLWLLGWVPGVAAPEVPVWSSVGRGISLVAWVVVWICPACMSVRATRELHAAIAARQEGDQ